ncbi:BON domain-containing protein [Sphingomonas sp. SUN039]|uniref:BON domain-containing protein n=1 Tax=Sphingomonas sp. SUN039 TaxID=2937787 RepID=UPI002164454D|nr:BON domain-containing protein [Sphingomonas sp. SUN039]UVO54933.1 BON domain-containing protein [Sphingomonas sp. SUN039]
MIAGCCLTVLFTAMVFGPMGSGRRYVDQLQHRVRTTLDARQLDRVEVEVQNEPAMRRIVVLSGPLAERDRRLALAISRNVPGVADVRWAADSGAAGAPPHGFSVGY